MSKRNQKRPQVYQKEFVRMLAETAMIPECEAEELAEIFLKTIVTSLLENRSVCFPEFGVFELREISERVGRNPKTMEALPSSSKTSSPAAYTCPSRNA